VVLAPAHSLSDRVSALEPTAVNAILEEVRQCRAQGKEPVSLMRGEPDLPTPPHIIEACSRSLRNGRTGPQECVAQMREEYARRREQAIRELAGIPGVRILPPEGGFFAMADAREWRVPSNEIRKRLLREHGVVVVHGSAYGPAGEGTLRVSFARGGDTLSEGLGRLREGLEHRH
jgi:aspartate/methionine/tyrosine aminotransferase